MHLLIRLGLLGLHAAWASNGAVEAWGNPANDSAPDGQSHPTIDAGATAGRRPEPYSQQLSQPQQHHQQQRWRRWQSVGSGNPAAGDDVFVASVWWHGKEAQEEERAQGKHQAPLESRGLLSFPWNNWWAREPELEHEEERPDTPMISRLKSKAFGANVTEDYAREWKGAGGMFGLSADWREAILLPDLGAGGVSGRHMSLRGEECMSEEKVAEVQAILEKRRTTSSRQNVAACVRTKDYGRFLPEWVAYHYAAGVDHITVYDDNSVDDTKEILQPFVKAGIVQYIPGKVEHRQAQMRPLNHCLSYHVHQRKKSGGKNSPRWVLFHDSDEYLYPVDTGMTIPQALEQHEEVCCVVVERLQYGSGGHDEMPRGLMLEEFLMHNYRGGKYGNGNAKVMVNLDPTQPELGTIKLPLRSMHNGEGCKCHGIDTNGVPELLINHYLGSIGDYMDRTVRYWKEKKKGGRGEMTTEKTALQRDTNKLRSDEIVHWACATREILRRVVEGLDLDDDAP
eukprot:g5635.t1